MSTICGHERGVLERALRGWELAPATTQLIIDGAGDFSTAEREARRDANSPAKLGEFFESEAHRFGFHTYSDDPGDSLELPCVIIEVENAHIYIEVYSDWAECSADPHGHQLNMLQARAIMSQWLPLPDGAREQAERILRGET